MAFDEVRNMSGYACRSKDVDGLLIRDIPRVLGINDQFFEPEIALYYLKFSEFVVRYPVNTGGWNNDRNIGDPSSFYRPALIAGIFNNFFDWKRDNAEIETLYMSGGMLVKFYFPELESAKSAPTHTKYPIGAGIREYALHIPMKFHLLQTIDLRKGDERLRL